MAARNDASKSRLIASLREGIAVVQMVFFKEIRKHLDTAYQQLDQPSRAMLAGAITNELFGTPNPEPKFVQFRRSYHREIVQELHDLARNLPFLRSYLTDALRVQALCDHQEGSEDLNLLDQARKLGILVEQRDLPLPSVFMTLVRGLGEQYQLIIPPAQISAEDDRLIH